ncbi:hypothetical protein Tco_1564240 [Tanacetum coccineum]
MWDDALSRKGTSETIDWFDHWLWDPFSIGSKRNDTGSPNSMSIISVIEDMGDFLRVLAKLQTSIRNTTRKCTAYHPQIDGQSEHEIRTLEESSLIGPELVQETTDKVVVIKEKLQVARDHQKSYADSRRKMTEDKVRENVLLKVSLWKGVMHFGKKGKLAPRYVGPFEILKRIGPVAYRLRLLKELIGVHDTFHVSNLEKKCLADANLHVPLDEIEADKTLCFIEEPNGIMEREI